jgi:hypothetical protein
VAIESVQSKTKTTFIFIITKNRHFRTMGSIVPEEAWITWQMSSFLQLSDGSQTGLGDHVLVRWEQLFQILSKK